MGNYYGKITCSHCYDTGHNKRTCPARKEQLESRLAAEPEGLGNYYARSLARMTGTNPVTGEEVSRRYEGNGRTCSYCTESGHNRRKCETLASDRRRYAALTLTARQSARSLLMERGIGVGAMIKHTRWGETTVGIVCTLLLDDVHHRSARPSVVLRPISKTHQQMTVDVRPATEDMETRSRMDFEVVGPLKPEQVSEQITDEWLNSEPAYGPKKDKDGIERIPNDIFVKGERRDTWFWQEQDLTLRLAQEQAAFRQG